MKELNACKAQNIYYIFFIEKACRSVLQNTICHHRKGFEIVAANYTDHLGKHLVYFGTVGTTLVGVLQKLSGIL